MFRAVLILAFCVAAGGVAIADQGSTPSPGVAPFVSVNAKSVAIVHVRVIDGTGSAARADRTVVFSDGIIKALGPTSQVAVPPGATVIDGSGRTVMPGYVGAHSHLFTGTGPRGHHMWRSMPFSFPRLYLAAGTTTIRTTGSMDIYSDLHVKSATDAGAMPGPHIDVTSPYLTGPGNQDPQMDELRDAADARDTVNFWADRGVTSFKVYTGIVHETLSAVIDAAHTRHLKVMGHLCSIGYREAAALGIDELEHGPYYTDTEFVPGKKADSCPDDIEANIVNAQLDVNGSDVSALITDIVRRRVPVSSTLTIFEGVLPNMPPAIVEQPTLDLLDAEQRTYVESVRAGFADGSILKTVLKDHPNYVESLRQLQKKEMAFELNLLARVAS